MNRSPLRLLLALAPALTVADAAAQGLMVCRHSPARIELYSASDGALLDAAFVDLDALLGLGGAAANIWDVVRSPAGQIWVSNYSAMAIQSFSSDGQNFLGSLPTVTGNSTGLHLAGTTLGITTPSGSAAGVHSFDTTTMTQTQVSTATGNWDVMTLGSEWLISRSNGTVVSLDPLTGVESPWSDPGGFCEQIATNPAGEILVANYGLQGYTVHDAMGTVLQTYTPAGVGNVRGVAQLGNGNVLLSGSSGVFVFDPNTSGVTMLDSGSGAFIFSDGSVSGGTIGTPYCSANVNSTGSVGELSASGSVSVAANDVTLEASQLPNFSFGFFIVSQSQGFAQHPGGSAGNLCLSGSVGRFVGPGQIQQSNNQGVFSLSIDLTSIPQPNGPEAVQSGDTWNFQVWHRDSAGGAPTSNFTPGLEIMFL